MIDELDAMQASGKGAIADGIAFVHSGATAPLLAALEQRKYDIETVIAYEGPHPTYKTNFTNPNLKRIIHVMGSGHDLISSLLEKDSPVPFLGWANFSNTAGNLTNINIEIKGAFHNDFVYNPADYADHTFWDEKMAERQRINRRTNLFMRDLYQAVLEDQTQPKRLDRFFESLKAVGAAKEVNGIIQIDPDFLRDVTTS